MTTMTKKGAADGQDGRNGRGTAGGILLGARVAPELAQGLGELAQENERTVSAELRLAVRHWLGMSADERTGPPSMEATDVEALPACCLLLQGGLASPDGVSIADEDGNELADVRRLVVVWEAGVKWPWAELQRYVMEKEGDMNTMQFDEADNPKLWIERRRVMEIRVRS